MYGIFADYTSERKWGFNQSSICVRYTEERIMDAHKVGIREMLMLRNQRFRFDFETEIMRSGEINL